MFVSPGWFVPGLKDLRRVRGMLSHAPDYTVWA